MFSGQNDAKHSFTFIVSSLRRLLFTYLVGFVWIRSGSSSSFDIGSVISCINTGSRDVVSY